MEHTLLSTIGYILGFLSFVFALFSSVSYFLSVKNENVNPVNEIKWKKLGRIGFILHSLSVLTIVGLVFFMLINHYYEFNYIWKYSNNSMPFKYIFACFWGGQEGSFMLWTFWNVILGLLLVWRAKKWEASVMATFALIQVFMSSMILGVYIGDLKVGSSPFVLIRMLPENLGLPWTELPDYMSRIPKFQDGKGLNPLLRNYWMTIHPPTLFLGFALTAVPFCYAIAGLWRQKLTEWIKPCLSWTFIGIGVLGVGILMGGAWAYESLSFGGFWAWDPVENVSYIPWLTFVGAGHLMLVNKRKPISLYLTFILAFLSFLLVLYSTFLTRSGVLGDSSVHSFTGDGMLGQLLLYILFFVWLAVFVMLPKGVYKLSLTVFSIFLLGMGIVADYDQDVLGINPAGILFIIGFLGLMVFVIISYFKSFVVGKAEEEELWSREFWMFLGSVVLFLAAFQIFIDNSFPVWNKLFNMKQAETEDIITYYNQWQGAFAVFISLFVGFTQFLKYKKTKPSLIWKNIALSVFVSIGLTALCLFFYDFSGKEFKPLEKIVYPALLFSSIYCIVGNLDYLIRFVKGKFNAAGSSIAHIGFGMVLLGALISNSQGRKLTNNKQGKFDLAALSENFDNDGDAQITKGDTVDVSEYFVVFKDRYQEDINIYYEMDYFEKVPTQIPNVFKPGKKLFTLNPFVQLNDQFGNAAEPATKHYFDYDVFTFIKYPNPSIFKTQNDGYMPYEQYEISIGDTVLTGAGYIVAKSVALEPFYDNDKQVITSFEMLDFKKQSQMTTSIGFMILGDTTLKYYQPDIHPSVGIKLGLSAFSPPVMQADSTMSKARFKIDIAQKEYVVMQAKTFPLINVLWLGIVIMLIGSIMAAVYRIKGKR